MTKMKPENILNDGKTFKIFITLAINFTWYANMNEIQINH